MKTTLEERLAAASANMKLAAHKTSKHPITSILSLCLVAGIAATIASFSQTSEPTAAVAPTAQTTPVARTVTDLKGRALEGTITGKTDTEVAFTRTDGQKFTIKLDTLSEGDQTFIAGLIVPDPNAVRKPTVLVVVDQYAYPENAELVEWLKAQNMEVTIGLLYGPNRKLDRQNSSIPNTEKAILLDQPTIPDAYDIVWIPPFVDSRSYQGKYVFFEITNHLLMTKRIMVVSLLEELAQLKYLVSYDVYMKAPRWTRRHTTHKDEFPQNFVGLVDKVVFYDDTVKPSEKLKLSKEEVREKLIKTVNDLLKK